MCKEFHRANVGSVKYVSQNERYRKEIQELAFRALVFR